MKTAVRYHQTKKCAHSYDSVYNSKFESRFIVLQAVHRMDLLVHWHQHSLQKIVVQSISINLPANEYGSITSLSSFTKLFESSAHQRKWHDRTAVNQTLVGFRN
jgi:hypothetical protein